MTKDHQGKLVHYLTDVYSIERQALAQLETAPEHAGPAPLAEAFRRHHGETERQAEAIEKRLEAHGESPARIKDAIMYVGGKGQLLFARVQPDTPGKLLAHAHSFEALEWASYDMLVRMAERAGDPETARVAREIRAQELAMRERLAALFDEAAAASIEERGEDDLGELVLTHLADAHAIESQSIQLLERSSDLAGSAALERLYDDHLAETREQSRQVEARLEALGGDPSTLKDTALRLGGLNWSLFFQAQSDTPGKLAVFAHAVEHLEVAGYELLRRVAEHAGDGETARLAATIADEERAMADRLAGHFESAFEASLDGS